MDRISQPQIRCLILGGSQALPRSWCDVAYEDTYIKKLEDAKYNIWPILTGGLSVSQHLQRAANPLSYINLGFFEIGIIHFGFVDAAPRPLPPRWRSKIDRWPLPIKLPLIKIIHHSRPFIQRYIGYHQMTSIEIFREDYAKLIELMKRYCQHIVIVLLAPVSTYVKQHSPGSEREIERYNQAVRQLVYADAQISVIDWDSTPESFLTNDAHITAFAHDYIYQCILKLRDDHH